MKGNTDIDQAKTSLSSFICGLSSVRQGTIALCLLLVSGVAEASRFEFSESLRECQKSSTFSRPQISDWSGKTLQVLHAERAGSACPSPNWNWLSVLDSRVVGYVQWIEVNFPSEGSGWAENLDLTQRDRWFFLDVSPESRLKRSPFYSIVRGDTFFFDNPRSSASRDANWQARVYGIVQEAGGLCKPIWGIQWGYSRRAGEPFPMPQMPKAISRQQWDRDWATVRGLKPNGDCVWTK